MSIKAALLFLLTSGPQTGYDATKHFGTDVGHVWHAPDSQIYPELRRLEAEGLIAGRDVPWGERGASKREYEVTDEGLDYLYDWQAEPMRFLPDRDASRLKAAYFEWADTEAIREHLEAHIEYFERARAAALEQIETIHSGDLRVTMRRLDHYAPEQVPRVLAAKIFAYEGSVRRAEAEIEWAKDGLTRLDELGGDPLPYRR